MRVAQFCDTFLPVVDGVGRVVSKYASVLGERCERCYVIAPEVPELYRGGLRFDIIPYLGVPVPKSPQYRVGFPVADGHYRRRIAAMDVDIVHAHSPFSAGYEAARFAKKRGLPLVGTFHSKYYDDFYQITGSDALSSLATDVVVRFFKKCDEVWAVSKTTAEVLHGYGYKGPIEIVENGYERKQPSSEASAAAAERFHLPPGNLLLFVGQMNWKKNIARILEALRLCLDSGTEASLLLAGQGPHLEEIRAFATKLSLQDRVIYTGHIDESLLLDGLYARADLLVFPSLYDNAPMVVREAASLATPSLLARNSGAAEHVKDGVNGFLCEDTSEDVAKVIATALSDKDKLHRVGIAARETLFSSWDTIFDDVIERYQCLILRKQQQKEGRML